MREWKEAILRDAWRRFDASAGRRDELEAFRRAPGQRGWLEDWALYAALTARRGRGGWPPAIERREPAAIEAARRELAGEIAYQEFLQLVFFGQWERLKRHARDRGITLFGDVPIYVAPDGADVWAHPELFELDEQGRALAVAGVPPDYFSDDGQLWGYPLYRWDRLEADGFRWWVDRLRAALRTADLVRLDHFRGFVAYWAVPAGEPTAVRGRWIPGPGRALFDALRRELGDLPLVAEDLGTITDDVRGLLGELDLPGMNVLQFAFSEPDSAYLPHRHTRRSVVYTGTHDNDTTRGWWASLDSGSRRRASVYLGSDGREIEWDLIRAAYTSVADRAIVPAADVFGLGSEARFNTPGRAEGNWSWRAREEDFTAERAARLARLAEVAGRIATTVSGRGEEN